MTTAARLERILARADQIDARQQASLDGLRRDQEFMGYCLEDVADSMRIHAAWPVAGGRCQHGGCCAPVPSVAEGVEAHIRACHWDDFQAMRKPFSPPGWHEASPGRWVPDREGARP